MKRLGFVFLIAALFCLITSTAFSTDLEIKGKAALLMDGRSGEIFYAQNIDEPLPVASISKLMTMTLALEAVDEKKVALTDLITTSERAASMGGSQVWLEIGEQLTLKEMLYAIAVGSANDASAAVAEYLSGSEANFAVQMNKRAYELGLKNTEFSNASGLPPSLLGGGKQLMSAHDVAILSRHCLTVPLLIDFVSTYEYTMRAQTTKRPQLWNYNKLLRRYQGVDGLKTGFTTEAGHCLAATAERNGLRLIAVVLGCSSEAERESDITKLLDYGFREYTNHLVAEKDTRVDELVLQKGNPELVNTVTSEDFFVTVKRGEQDKITTEITYFENLKLPLTTDTVIGMISAYQEQKLLGTMYLNPEQNIEKGSIFVLIIRTANSIIDALLKGS